MNHHPWFSGLNSVWKLREKLQAFLFLYQPTTLRIIVAIFPWPRMFLGVHSYFPWWEEFTFWITKTPSLESPRKMFSKRNSYIGDGTPSTLQWNFTGCPCVTVFSGRLDVSLVALGLCAQKKKHRQSKKGLSNNLLIQYHCWILELGPVYMVSVTRDSSPPETTLPSVYMRIAWPRHS